jgi:hypothetical protein
LHRGRPARSNRSLAMAAISSKNTGTINAAMQ